MIFAWRNKFHKTNEQQYIFLANNFEEFVFRKFHVKFILFAHDLLPNSTFVIIG